MMMLVTIFCVLSYASLSLGQPVSCSEDTHCHEGLYCETSLHICRQCLSCEDLFRQTLLPTSDCVKSVADCGPCLDGRIADLKGDLECVLPDDTNDGSPYYIWAIIVGSLLIVLFLVAVISVCLFKGNMLKISTRTWLRQSCEPELRASAPEPPPPYNPYSPVRPDSPYSPPAFDTQPMNNLDHHDEELSRPFIKRAGGGAPLAARESSDNQNARMYSPPNYLRTQPSPNPPLSPDDMHLNSPIHDENTSESNWTPTATSVNNVDGSEPVSELGDPRSNVNTSNDLSALVAAARESTLVEPPPKKLCSHDTNNNGNNENMSSDSSSSVASTSHAHTHGPPAMFVNIQVNNTVGTAFSGQLIKTNKS